jgi:glutamine synthetase type III
MQTGDRVDATRAQSPAHMKRLETFLGESTLEFEKIEEEGSKPRPKMV